MSLDAPNEIIPPMVPLDQASFSALGQAPGHHPLALAFARALSALLAESDPVVLWIGYGLMVDVQEGQSCWTLAQAGGRIASLWRRAHPASEHQEMERVDARYVVQRCLESKAIGKPGSDAPIIMDEGTLYLRKLYQAEQFIATWVKAKLQGQVRPLPASAAAALPELFRFSEALTQDLQCIAAVNAWMTPLALLAGGPGTGKTYTVVNYLALCMLASEAPPKVLLLAPTGKAAARLAESVLKAKQALELPASVLDHIPEQGMTLHRALGLAHRDGPTRHRLRPLDADIIVVDETSMVDLVMMAQLLDAVPDRARLLLVGDANQLASVNAGAVFGDLCQGQDQWSPSDAWHRALLASMEGKAADPVMTQAPTLADVRVHLVHSRRYDPNAGIGPFARALLAGDIEHCLQALRDSDQPELSWVELDATAGPATATSLWAPLVAHCRRGYEGYINATSPRARLQAKGHFQVLCATRSGPYGVETANAELWRHLFIKAGRYESGGSSQLGMAIMMTRNDYATGLFNGDVGVIEVGPGGSAFAYFEKEAGEGELHALSLSRIGAYDPAFAMTIHKSQGSEYDHVMVVLGDQVNAGLNRELLYTAVTRAKKRVCIVASEQVLAACIRNRVQRNTGLGDRLRSCDH